jgi:predicted ATPase with chaperone activity
MYTLFCFRQTHSEKSKVFLLLSELQASGMVKTVNGNESFTRVVQNENKVKVVKQMPKIVKAKQPTIAIITSQYCEKLAVDAMMDDQETFVRYTTVGAYLFNIPLVTSYLFVVPNLFRVFVR